MRLAGRNRSKYRNQRTEVDGITFDSKAEAEYYIGLKLLMKSGVVEKFVLQPKFCIIDGYNHPATGEKIKATYYVADFHVWYKDGREEIVDVKGAKTEAYKLKKKLFESKYGKPITEVGA